MADEQTPLVGSSAGAAGDEAPFVPAYTLAYYWPCLIAGVLANTLAVCASVAITKDILDDPVRAAYYQTHWYIVWLVGVLLLMGARPPPYLRTTRATPLTRPPPHSGAACVHFQRLGGVPRARRAGPARRVPQLDVPHPRKLC